MKISNVLYLFVKAGIQSNQQFRILRTCITAVKIIVRVDKFHAFNSKYVKQIRDDIPTLDCVCTNIPLSIQLVTCFNVGQ